MFLFDRNGSWCLIIFLYKFLDIFFSSPLDTTDTLRVRYLVFYFLKINCINNLLLMYISTNCHLLTLRWQPLMKLAQRESQSASRKKANN